MGKVSAGMGLQRVLVAARQSVHRQRLSLFRFQTVCRRDAAVELLGMGLRRVC